MPGYDIIELILILIPHRFAVYYILSRRHSLFSPGSGLSGTPISAKTPSSKQRTPLLKNGLDQTPLDKELSDQTPLRKGMSQTPLTRYGNLAGLLSQESEEEEEEEEERVSGKGKKRRALYSDLLDNEAEKSGSDHSEDENEGIL